MILRQYKDSLPIALMRAGSFIKRTWTVSRWVARGYSNQCNQSRNIRATGEDLYETILNVQEEVTACLWVVQKTHETKNMARGLMAKLHERSNLTLA
jgi:hypothetical protein